MSLDIELLLAVLNVEYLEPALVVGDCDISHGDGAGLECVVLDAELLRIAL